jgi:hypothetical protein
MDMGRRRHGRACRRVLLLRLRESIGREPGTRNRSRRDADQEGAASFIMLAHASSLLAIKCELR